MDNKLEGLSEAKRPIKIGLAGLGQMGRGLLSQMRGLKGMEVAAAADRDVKAALNTFKKLGIPPRQYYVADSGGCPEKRKKTVEGISMPEYYISDDEKKKIAAASENNILVYSEDLRLLFESEGIDVIVDATGNPEAGAYIAINALSSGKHLITLNVEMDVTIGPFLRDLSRKYGVIYSLSAGDEPPAAKELFDFAQNIGMEVVAAGKGKNNPLDRYADPGSLAGYAREKGSNPYMMTSFVDGTKSMVEMACLSNATGLVPDCRGMHAARVDRGRLLDVVRLKSQGGILEKSGVVEFVIGDLAPGVFLVYTTKNPIIREELKYLLMGDGPNYLLYRPYHLTSLETPISVARACLDGEPTMTAAGNLVSEVITVAKKDLKAGERIDRIGGYTVYGLIDTVEKARKESLLPIGLCEGAVIKNAMEKDRPITYNDVDLSRDSLILRIRKLQDSMEKEGKVLGGSPRTGFRASSRKVIN
jgi:predicted homoserine dehydrogenase-like protein